MLQLTIVMDNELFAQQINLKNSISDAVNILKPEVINLIISTITALVISILANILKHKSDQKIQIGNTLRGKRLNYI